MAEIESVLIVDNNERCAAFMSLAFETQGGIRVSSEKNSLHAHARISDERPSLVMVAIKLRGLDGFDLLARLRASGDTTPVIVLSGSARQEDIDRAYTLGCNGYFAKPISIAAYQALADAVIDYWRQAVLPTNHSTSSHSHGAELLSEKMVP